MIDSLAEPKKRKILHGMSDRDGEIRGLLRDIHNWQQDHVRKLEGNEREEPADEDRMKGYYYQFKV